MTGATPNETAGPITHPIGSAEPAASVRKARSARCRQQPQHCQNPRRPLCAIRPRFQRSADGTVGTMLEALVDARS